MRMLIKKKVSAADKAPRRREEAPDEDSLANFHRITQDNPLNKMPIKHSVPISTTLVPKLKV